ncbi:MAG: YbaB/EbfC family nucleoid-associated protein [Candidatus Peribacteraceae bacterium]|jgi:DNA-binding protein YbaB|nr:YbaB/EbfC family nucleoid-associated protein [Candidatus Peribacteraceae bacterium]
MPSFSQIKDMFRVQREAKKVKKELKKIHVEAEGRGVKVVVTAEMEIVSIEIAPDAPRETLGREITDCLNRALKKAQVVSAEKMQGVMGEMGFPTDQGAK